VRIVWDPAKSDANLCKHDVSFEEAAKLLDRESGFLGMYDERHSVYEDRFIAIGWANGGSSWWSTRSRTTTS
jgi:uncharacterized DUF497 family protein